MSDLSELDTRLQDSKSELVQLLVQFSGLNNPVHPTVFKRAVQEELVDQCQRLRTAIGKGDPELNRILEESENLSQFPEAQIASRLDSLGSERSTPLERELAAALERYRSFVRRLDWLVHGTSDEELDRLDPIVDCDRISHRLNGEFQFEAKMAEFLVISRIAQSTSVLPFFRSTREAEDNSAKRYYDTYSLFANFYEWGIDSQRGRQTVERLNQIHGRYYIANDGMKYVLLETAFTWLDAMDRIGHRPLKEVEKRGFFHAHIRLGRAMNIQNIDDDFDKMYGWYQEFNRATADFHPSKQQTFEMLFDRSLVAAFPGLKETFRIAVIAAMDDTYRTAVGWNEVTPEEIARVRSVTWTIGSLTTWLGFAPYLRSLQNNAVRRGGTSPQRLGVDDRSQHLPRAYVERENGGAPVGQKPLLSVDDAAPMELPVYSWDEIRRHDRPEDLWVVIEDEVYDFTNFAQFHPAGAEVLHRLAGKDATKAFRNAGHSAVVDAFRLNYRIGKVERG